MPLFEVDARRSALVQPLAPGDTAFIRTAEPVVDDHVSRLLGEQIFPVVGRTPAQRPEDAPHLLALDAAGHPVVIEMVARLDASSLALALAHAGRAGRLTLAEVAERFPEGLPAFERAYDEFRRKSPIARTRGQREGSRLLLLCAQVDPAVTDALDFLRVTNRAVTALRLGVVTGPDGRRLVEVEPLHGARRPEGAEASSRSVAAARTDAVPDDDVADATTIRPALRRPVVAPTAVTGTTATTAGTAAAPADDAPASAPERVSALPERSALSDRYGLPNRRSFSTTEQVAPAAGAAAAANEPAPAQGSAQPTTTGSGPTRVSTRAAARAAAASAPVPPPPMLSRPPVEDDLPRSRSAVRAAAQPAPAEPSSNASFTPREEASAASLPPRRSRAERRRAAEHGSDPLLGSAPPPPTSAPGAGVVPLSDAHPAHPTDHATAPLDASVHRVSSSLSLSGPVSSPLPVPSPQLPLHGDPADDDPDLFMLAQHLGTPTHLVWSRPRRGERFEAVLHPEGQIELPGTGRYRNPDAAATAAVGSRREDGWDVWRLGDSGPSLTDLFREQFA